MPPELSMADALGSADQQSLEAFSMRTYALIGVTAGFALALGSEFSSGKPPRHGEGDRIAGLIARLGDEDFATREAASKALEAVGEPALPALRQAAASSPDAEVRRRAEGVIQALAGVITKKELAKLQGTWWLISYDASGNRIKGEDKAHLFIFKGDKWAIRVGGQVFQAGTVQRIEVKSKLNAIDLLITQGGNTGVTALSIYALEGESLKYVNGNPRPTELTTKKGDGWNYSIFRRAKP
jgi:uncharacterized protein (TIGR03067 family)